MQRLRRALGRNSSRMLAVTPQAFNTPDARSSARAILHDSTPVSSIRFGCAIDSFSHSPKSNKAFATSSILQYLWAPFLSRTCKKDSPRWPFPTSGMPKPKHPLVATHPRTVITPSLLTVIKLLACGPQATAVAGTARLITSDHVFEDLVYWEMVRPLGPEAARYWPV